MGNSLDRRTFTRNALVAFVSCSLEPAFPSVDDRDWNSFSLQIFGYASVRFQSLLDEYFSGLAAVVRSSPLAKYTIILANPGKTPLKAVSVRWSSTDQLGNTISYIRNFMHRATTAAIARPYTGSAPIVQSGSYLLINLVCAYSPGTPAAKYSRTLTALTKQTEAQDFIAGSDGRHVYVAPAAAITKEALLGPDQLHLRTGYAIRTQSEHDEARNISDFIAKGATVAMVCSRLESHQRRYFARSIRLSLSSQNLKSQYWSQRAVYASKLSKFIRLRGPAAFRVLISLIEQNSGWTLTPWSSIASG